MPRYVAFLRAINVSGRVVKMERLRALFAELGFANVKTFIASGNVIFEARSTSAAALQKKIEAHLQAALAYDVATFLRTDRELEGIATHPAFPAAATAEEGAMVYVVFLAAEPTEAAATILTGHGGSVDEFKIRGREIYWLCRKRFSDSEFSGARLEKILGMPATVRNSTTVRRLIALLRGSSA